MLFIPNERYQITYEDGEIVGFTVISNETSFHQRRAILDESGTETHIYKLLLKNWKTVVHIPDSELPKI